MRVTESILIAINMELEYVGFDRKKFNITFIDREKFTTEEIEARYGLSGIWLELEFQDGSEYEIGMINNRKWVLMESATDSLIATARTLTRLAKKLHGWRKDENV